MKGIISLLAIISFGAVAGLQDAPVDTIDNTSRETSGHVHAGFIINDDDPDHEFKLETTYGKNSGVISVRTSNGDNNEEVMSVDFASQKELEQERQFTNAQINGVNQAVNGAYSYIQYESEQSNQRDQDLAESISNTNQNVRQAIEEGDQRMTAAEQELYSTTALSKANEQGVADNRASATQNRKGVALNREAIAQTNKRIDNLALEVSDLRDDMYRGVASAMAVGMLQDAPAGSYGFVAGVGTYGSKEALAVGFSASGESLSFKVGATYDKEEVGAAASVGYWFK